MDFVTPNFSIVSVLRWRSPGQGKGDRCDTKCIEILRCTARSYIWFSVVGNINAINYVATVSNLRASSVRVMTAVLYGPIPAMV